jgi:hypothetical protein
MPRFLLLMLLMALSPVLAAAEIVPPVLVDKEANRWSEPLAGTVSVLETPTSTTFVLYLPEKMEFGAGGGIPLTIHFHGAAWFIQQEHVRRGARHPLLVGNAKEGDAAFEVDVMKPGVLEGLLKQTEAKLREADGPANAAVDSIELSGFSAGYAGVRGVLRMPQFEPMVSRVLLNDSLYVGNGPDSKEEDRRPRMGEDGLGPFLDFARKAAAGERELLMEFSSTPSMRSVGPKDCALAIVRELSIPVSAVPMDSIPAARTSADFQLTWRAGAGKANFLCYHSETRPMHLAHVRNQADFWRAMDGLTRTEAIPPAMPQRSILPPASPYPTTLLDIGTTGTVSLFVPANYKVPKDGVVEVTLHFHGATWFVIDEHLRRGGGEPLVALELGQGSSVYQRPFTKPETLDLLLEEIEKDLVKRGAPEDTRIKIINLTSFSAGYGAIREIMKTPRHVAMTKRVLLADSSYGSLDEEALKEGLRSVAPEHVEPWANFARLAMEGNKTLLMITSDITPQSYAGTHEVAAAVVGSLGLPVRPGEATDGEGYPLRARADRGSFHWWAYQGDDAPIHSTIARHIADAWMALDQNGDP